MSDGTQDKRKQLRARDAKARRNRVSQERAREAMNAEIHRVYAENDDGNALLRAAASRSESAREQSDPMALTGSRKAMRREADRREALTRRHLVYLLERKTIDMDQFKAAAYLHDLILDTSGGMQAMDWTRERVDGGKGPSGLFIGGALDAERALKQAFVGAGLSFDQQEIVLRVVGQEESVTSVAISFERDEKAKVNGACARETRAHVKLLLGEALRAVFEFEFKTNRMDERPARAMLRAWHAEGSIPTDRPDIRAAAGEAARRA